MNPSIKEQLRKIAVLRMINRTLDKLFTNIRRGANKLGGKRKCYICGRTFNHFTKFRGGSKNQSRFHRKLDVVGSDTDNFGCMYCGCHDRERHLFMFFDRLGLWENMQNQRIIHFAPERHVARKINEQTPSEYVKADLNPQNEDTWKIDATKIPYNDATFDLLIANHILEHIPDYRKALSEFYRILKPGGIAILQTPYSRLLNNNFEDDGIDSDELRLIFYGQEDHVRTFGEGQFLESLKETGFSVQVKRHQDCFNASETIRYGVPKDEDLILVEKLSKK